MLLFNIIALNNNTYVKFIKKFFDASQIEFLLHALRVRLSSALSGLFDLIVIVEQLLQMTKSLEVSGCQVW